MKKKFIASMLVLFIISSIVMMGNAVKAFSDDEFTLNVPSSYDEKEIKTGSSYIWNGDKGSVNVQIQSYDSKEYKGDMKSILNQIADGLVDEGTYSEVTTKEITKVSKNNYECIHISGKIKSIYTVYGDQYLVISKDKMYVLTFAGTSKDYFSSSEVKDMINSFEIKNYKPAKAAFNWAPVIVVICVVAAGAGFYVVKNKKQNM